MALTPAQHDYAFGFVRSLAGGAVPDVPAALLETVFSALARTEEENGPRDTWGNWDWQYSAANRSGNLYRPWLDEAVLAWLEGAEIPRGRRWPEGKRFAMCLTHDVDVVTDRPKLSEAWRYARTLGQRAGAGAGERFSLLRRPWLRRYRTGRATDVLWHYDRWVKEEQRHGFRSTFLMFPEVHCRRHLWDCTYRMSDALEYDGQRTTVAGMCRTLADAGWDVGLHGSYYSYDDAAVLREQKQQIEAASGQEVVSTRQHYLHYEATRTPAAQSQAGLRVDSTLGFNRNLGFRSGTSQPWYAWDAVAGASLPLLEIPLVVLDVSLFSAGALEYSREDTVVAHAELASQLPDQTIVVEFLVPHP